MSRHLRAQWHVGKWVDSSCAGTTRTNQKIRTEAASVARCSWKGVADTITLAVNWIPGTHALVCEPGMDAQQITQIGFCRQYIREMGNLAL